CDTTGKSTASAKAKHANAGKNDFCAPGPAVTVTLATFAKLQAASDLKHVHFGGPSVLPKDRSVLHDLVTTTDGATIGAGSLIRFVGYVHSALYSDATSGGESCNCSKNGDENNDIHIYLVGTPSAAPCTGIVAEMSPHFRPLKWTVDQVTATSGRPIRVSGA